MKTKFSGILTLLLAFVVQMSFAQEKTISGTVSDDMGLPLPGVNIIIKNTSTGTQSDIDGNFTINASVGQTLVFTYVGFINAERPVTVATSTINLSMQIDAAELDAVIVTALGIERSERSLGYAVSTIRSEEINEVRETNLMNALQGRSSGVTIQQQSGNVGASSRILIRGISTLRGDAQPLFVVDGVPISNANINTGDRITGGYDFGNRAQDINPDDIDNVTILKGASAAALYGSRAANGVILITTKRGKSGRAASFEVSSSLRFDTPLQLPDFQNSYVFGSEGEVVLEEGASIAEGGFGFPGWGPNINDVSGQTYVNHGGEEVGYQMYPNNVRDFYGTGITSIHSFAASGASQDGADDYRLSFSYTDQEGMIPSSRLNRTNVSANAGSRFNEQLKSRVNFNYSRTNTVGTAAAGANDPNVLTTIVNGLPRTTDIGIFRDDIDAQGNQINPVGTNVNNPYFIARRNASEVNVERFYGNAQLEYEPVENLTFLARAGYDSYLDQRLRKNSKGTLGRFDGNFTDDYISSREVTLDFLTNYDWNINEDLTLSARVGTQWSQRVINRIGNDAVGLTVPGLLAPGNANSNSPFKAFSDRRIQGVFGDVTLDYKGWFFLNATGRNDWSSTLPVQNRSFFYPSVSASLVFTDAFDMDSTILNYGKIRGSWANVGVDTAPYQLDFTFSPLTSFFGQFGTGGTYPFNGNLAFGSSGTLPDANLKPENQESYEFGVELGLLRNRVTIDATVYRNVTQDQIIALPTPQTSGFGAFLTNIGQISNEGIEVELGIKPIRTENFSWDLNYNFTTNKFRVDDLGDLEALNLDTEFNGLAVRAVEGGDLQLFGPRFRRALDADGNEIEDQILVDDQGRRQIGQSESLGSIFPDYVMGLNSVFRYKNFALSTTFDFRSGGVMFSNTVGQLRRDGLAIETAIDDRANLIDTEAFMMDSDGNVVPNTIEVSAQEYWRAYSSASVAEGNIFDATFIKWRELSLTYTFTPSQLERTFIKGLRIGVQGRNLAIFNSKVPHIDPEASIGGAGSNLQGIERGGVPNTRSIGMNVNINF